MVLVSKPQKPATMQHKKRSGQHHQRTGHYAKPYWPYLPMLAVAGIGILANMLWTQPKSGVLAYATATSTSGLLRQTNVQRLDDHEAALALNQQLSDAAQAKANDMAARGYWAHVTPDGRQPWWFINNAGYQYQEAGENLAYGFANSSATVTGWMNSPGHRANILNADYSDVGFGIANAENYQGEGPATIVVAMYGTPAGGAAAATGGVTAAPTNVPTASGSGRQVLDSNTTPSSSTPAASEPVTGQSASASTDPSRNAPVSQAGLQRVSRLQLTTALSPLGVAVVLVVVAMAAGLFILRHAIFWHRMLAKGERFAIRHWKLDLAILAVVAAGVVLTRTAGFIM